MKKIRNPYTAHTYGFIFTMMFLGGLRYTVMITLFKYTDLTKYFIYRVDEVFRFLIFLYFATAVIFLLLKKKSP